MEPFLLVTSSSPPSGGAQKTKLGKLPAVAIEVMRTVQSGPIYRALKVLLMRKVTAFHQQRRQ